MKDLIGKTFAIAGMDIRIVADAGDKWETLNLTTNEPGSMDKKILQNAIKLGKAEESH